MLPLGTLAKLGKEENPFVCAQRQLECVQTVRSLVGNVMSFTHFLYRNINIKLKYLHIIFE